LFAGQRRYRSTAVRRPCLPACCALCRCACGVAVNGGGLAAARLRASARVQLLQPLKAAEFLPALLKELDGQPHHVLKRAFKRGDNLLAPFLNAVSTGLVERVYDL